MLLKEIESRDLGSELLVHTRGLESCGSIAAHVRTFRARNAALRDSTVVVAVRDPGGLAMTLIALDGFAGRIVLAPSSIDRGEVEAMAASLAPGGGITDREDFLNDSSYWMAAAVGDQMVDGEGEEAASVETGWIIPTSGTTGTPKLVEHTLRGLTRTVRRGKSGALRWAQLYDASRFAGLQVFFQAVIGGGVLIMPDLDGGFRALVTFLARQRVNAISATPSLWRKMIMLPEAGEIPLEFVTLGGEVADDAILAALRTHFPTARLTHIYASTEAGVGFSVRDGQAGFPCSYCEAPQEGVGIRVDADGMLWLRPPAIEQKFAGETGGALADSEGWIRTGDLVKEEHGRYTFLGRESGAINVGGQKVHPSEVEEVVLAVPGVSEAWARGRSNPILGQLVELLVVPAEDADPAALEGAIMRECRERLSDYKVPALVQLVDQIDLTPTGKIAR